MRSMCLATAFACALPLFATMAHAQDSKTAAAIAAFDEAQDLMSKDEVASACAKYGQSQRLDPQLGTLLHWAHCLERNGQIASAWTNFREAAELAQKKGDSRQGVAEERAAALQPKLSRLRFALPEAGLPPNARVTRGGVVVDEDLLTIATPVDPGTYQIEVSAPGYHPWRGEVVVSNDGSVSILDVPSLQPESAEPSEEPNTSIVTTEDRGVSTPGEPGLFAAKWPAFVVGGVGLAGAAVWTVFGLSSMDAKSKADEVCTGSVCTTDQGRTWRREAYAAGNVATVGAIVTGVGLASAAVLWLALPSPQGKETVAGNRHPHALRVGFGPTELQVTGTF